MSEYFLFTETERGTRGGYFFMFPIWAKDMRSITRLGKSHRKRLRHNKEAKNLTDPIGLLQWVSLSLVEDAELRNRV